MNIENILNQIEQYFASHKNIPTGYKPIIQVSSTAKLLIVGQAPGIRAQTSGIPWNDRSGDRLRSWLTLTKEEFYDVSRIAIMPIGFYYPGVDKYGGDKPPSSECARLWHRPLLDLMPDIKLTLLIGSHAQNFYLKDRVKPSLSETVLARRDYLPDYFVLPHPSWRNNAWIERNKWFTSELLPEVRNYIKTILRS